MTSYRNLDPTTYATLSEAYAIDPELTREFVDDTCDLAREENGFVRVTLDADESKVVDIVAMQPCYLCGGDGDLTCAACRGNGCPGCAEPRSHHHFVCTCCNGSGSVVCDRCNGSGETPV